MGVKSKTIHSLSQALGTGVVFLELQLKEYTAAFLTFRDSIYGLRYVVEPQMKYKVPAYKLVIFYLRK